MIIVGRITKHATVKKVKDHHDVVGFDLAVNDYYKPKGSVLGVTHTTYYSCSYWISPAVAPLLTKGSLVELEGRASVNAYQGLDGVAKASLNFHVNSIKIHQQKKAEASPVSKESVADDLPF